MDEGSSEFDDAAEFAKARGAMTVCQFSPEDMWNCWTIVAFVLHCGNIQFGGKLARS